MIRKYVYFILLIFIALQLVFLKNACAYLDPGTGSYVFQVLVAAFFGGLFTIKTFWQEIKGFLNNHFLGKKGKKEAKP